MCRLPSSCAPSSLGFAWPSTGLAAASTRRCKMSLGQRRRGARLADSHLPGKGKQAQENDMLWIEAILTILQAILALLRAIGDS